MLPVRSKCVLLFKVVCLVSTQLIAQIGSQEEALQNQRRGIALIDQYIEHFRKTGEQKQADNKLERAQTLLEEAYEVFIQNRDFANASLCLTKSADSWRLRSNWRKALQLYDQALDLVADSESAEMQAKALLGKARALMYGSKDYSQAALQVDAAIPLSETLADRSLLFNLLDMKAQILDATNNVPAAADAVNRAVEIARRIGDQKLLVFGYMDRGGIYLNLAEQCDYTRNFKLCLGMVDSSRKDYQRMLDLCNNLGYAGLAGYAKQFLDGIDARQALIESQQRYHQTFSKTNIFRPRTFADVLVNTNFLIKDPGDGLGSNTVLLRTLIEEMNILEAVDTRSAYIRGLLNEMEGNHDAALQEYLKAVDLLDRDRRKLRDGELRGTFLEDKINFYYPPIIHLLERGKTARAFQLLEESKSRALADLLDTKEIELQNLTAQKLQSREKELRARLATAQRELFLEYTAKTRMDDRIEAKGLEIDELESKYDVLLERIRSEAPEMMEIVESEPVSLKSLQQSLPKDTEIIEYLALESQLLVWHISKRRVTVKSVFLPRTEIPGKVTELYKSLKTPEQTFDRELARELFLYLIRPIRDFIQATRLVIIPHEELSYIPFQVLFDQQTNKYLGESHQISYAPSASIFSKMERGSLSGKLLAIADPRSNIFVDEATTIAKAYSAGDSEIFVKSLISEARFKSIAGHFSIIHLSVHGKYDFKDPLLSHLALSPGQNEDGNLTAAEIFGLPFQNVNLVTLSACESGRFEATHANEILGISRALIYAGAKASILSFWKVDARSTRLWMETFYQQGITHSLAEAAQRALIRVKSHREFGHPYYWAAFFLLGK